MQTTIEGLKQVLDMPVVITDHQGLITYINASFRDVLGWSEAEILGQPLATIIPKAMHDAHHMGFSRFIATEKPRLLQQPLTLKVVAKDGGEIDAEHTIIAERLQGQWVFGATIRPLAAR